MLTPRSNVTIMVIILIIMMTSMTGCAATAMKSTRSPTVQEIDEKIRQSMDISSMKPSDETKLKKLYDINADELEAFAFYTASSNLKANELLVVRVKDINNVAAIKDKIAKRVDKQSTTFRDYLPEEHFLIQKHISRVHGNYILFVISRDAEKIASAFDQALK